VASLLNVTFGNAAEIIIGIVAISAGLLTLVKASIIGSIIGNILLIFGLSLFAGGLRQKEQFFNKENT
jgi:Ca2+:H+ antiporter